MMGGAGRNLAVVASLVLLSFLATRTADAQGVNGCAVMMLNRCSLNSYCYNAAGSSRCYCSRGYYGDGYMNGSGCRQRRFAIWRLVLSVVGSILAAVLLLSLCLSCLGNSRRRRLQQGQNDAYPLQQPQGAPAVYGYPTQNAAAGYPPHPGGYANYKVPGPAGAV